MCDAATGAHLPQSAVATGGGAVLKSLNTGAIFLHLQTSGRCDEVRARLPQRPNCLKLRAGIASAAQASSQTRHPGIDRSQDCQCLSCAVVTLAAKMI